MTIATTKTFFAATALTAFGLAGAQPAQATFTNPLSYACPPAHDAYQIDLTGHGEVASSQRFSDGNVDIDATATWQDAGGSGDAQVGAWGPGLGVISPGDTDHQVDGHGKRETLTLTADREVQWSAVSFSHVDRGLGWIFGHDDVELIGDQGSLGFFDLGPTVFDDRFTLNLAALGYAGQSLGLKAFCPDDEWKVSGVAVNDIAAMPTPTAALAGVGMLGGLALRRRRQTRG